MANTIIVHTEEICLKGGNRGLFERALMNNIRIRLSKLAVFSYRRDQGTFTMSHDGEMSSELESTVRKELHTVFGIAYFMIGTKAPLDIEAIANVAIDTMPREENRSMFRVTAKRSYKPFPMNSQAVAAEIGGRILDAVLGTSVSLKNYATDIRIEIAKDGAFISDGRESCFGGLPTGTGGKVVSLLSGGIDSPVATWKLLKRGCEAVLVHFHSYPYVGQESIDKVKRLAEVLDTYQKGTKLYLIPFAETQKEIVAKTPDAMRILLYRRTMLRIAEKIAEKEGALALINGDALGQVSSQTLENIATVSAVATLPLFRPLVGENKNEIIRIARDIGTYDIAIEPHEDCCSLFMPANPATRSTAAYAEKQEALLDIDALVASAISSAEIVTFSMEEKVAVTA